MKTLLWYVMVGIISSLSVGASIMWAAESLLAQWDITGPGYWHCFWCAFFLIGTVGTIKTALEMSEGH